MATQPGAGAPAGAAHTAGSPQQLNQIVMEYLSKKGYSKTEAMLRVESAHTDADGRPIIAKPEEYADVMYERAYSHLRRWIDNSLDIYKPDLKRLEYPIFIHFYLTMISGGHLTPGKTFWKNHVNEHEATHGYDLEELSRINLPVHVEENKLAKLYRTNKYRVKLPVTTKNLLLHFLEETADDGGQTLLSCLNQHIELISLPGRASLFVRGAELQEGEGIVGHTSGRGDLSENLPNVKLGMLPMDKELMKEVEEELREEDTKMKDISRSDELGVTAGKSLIDEFSKIKREEGEDSPAREAIPLPPYTIADVEDEVRQVKEYREKVQIKGGPSPALPSVCMYTFHNTNDGLHCLDFSQDAELVAGGFAESYVRVWSLKGTPLESIIPSENLPVVPKSRRLIGHSGPIYGVSFSPDRKYLLSSSEDKSTRLWSMDTYTALVVYKGHDAPVWDVSFGPFGHYFATASYEHTARLWSCDHIYPLRIFAGHLSDVDTVTWHPNSTYLFTGSADKTARMWDVNTGNSVRLFSGHSAPVTAIAASPDGKYLATAGEDSLISIWDIAGGKRLKAMRGHGKTSIYSLSFSRESNVLVSGGADMTVRCWDVLHGTGLPTQDAPEPMPGMGPVDGTAKVDLPQGGNNKRRGKDVVATPDQLAVWYTKKAPVYKVQFTRKNMVMAGSAFLP
ncbi:Similar to Transcription initiation factor TFIID subunit 5; acc. no. O13282 [Pyronema omphalodes CBS 100304]|uniref:Similar to Transcription initiation factor TFIID subunit 5 acc. no. O13282 n=1 Tax=Pyronema omphalodes (strain CBS 100304) TaxID=1076935 RepID=U4LVS4_PYROM|nr:Similar to Transcription initiation factor TFIID subunit 5; acc. no. O13282 [Pyronema omphalodes CBS 100304]